MPVFKLSDLAKLYNECLLPVGIVSGVHSTRLPSFFFLLIQRDGTFSTANKNVGAALKQACNYVDEPVHLVKAAQII